MRGAIVLDKGELKWPPPKVAAPSPSAVAPAVVAPKAAAPAPVKSASGHGGHGHATPAAPSKHAGVVLTIAGLVAAGVWTYLRYGSANGLVSQESRDLFQHASVFIMAIFVGWQVVWNVTPALHTPLMSVTNAISGIIVVGGMVGAMGASHGLSCSVLVAMTAILFATINIAGGFTVTRRMLAMFRK